MNKTQVDFLVKLQRKKYRDKHQKFIIENPKVILEEYSNPLLDSVYITDNFFKDHEDEMVFSNVHRISEKDIKKVSSQVTPAGMFALFNMPKLRKFTFQKKHILLLDKIQDPGNLGTIIRTADWFGFQGLFLSKNCVEVFNPKVIAATMGSIFHLNIYDDLDLVDFIKDLKQEKYIVATTALTGDKIDIKAKDKLALIIGNESKGVSPDIKELADKSFQIPKFGKAESLNAAVAAGIIMHQIKE